jgi:hypothetical protein
MRTLSVVISLTRTLLEHRIPIYRSGGSDGRRSVTITGINEARYSKKVAGGRLTEIISANRQTRHSPVRTLPLNKPNTLIYSTLELLTSRFEISPSNHSTREQQGGGHSMLQLQGKQKNLHRIRKKIPCQSLPI